MNHKYIFFILFSLLFSVEYSFSQDDPVTPVGKIISAAISQQKIVIKTTNAYAEITVYSPSVIRVRIDRKPFTRDFSYAVVAKPEVVRAKISQTDQDIDIATDSLKAVIQKNAFSIAFFTPSGELISTDEKGLTTSWVGQSVTTYKTLQENEHFIGLGEKTGNFDRTGNGYTHWNSDAYAYTALQDPLYSTFPFYIGIHHHINYGIFLDNTWQSDFNFGASNNRFSSFGARGGEMDYYFIYHQRLADIITSYTWLTGRMPLPPLWALGYQQNRFSYYPESEVMRIAHTLRENHIPADGITLDIHYMDKYQLFTWNKARFPDPAGMNAELNKLGFKTTVIVDPGIKVEKGAAAYEEGLKNDVYIKYPDGQPYTGQVWPGWCNFTDFTSEKGRSWWHKQVKFFADAGVSGIWNDMNEFSTWGQKAPDNILFDYDGRLTTHLEAHNVYGMQMARASYEGAVEHLGERPFVLSRSGYAGLQRYSALWTGDNRAEEDHMLLGVRLLSSLGLSGMSFTGMDVGGFTGSPTVPLYARWMEIGAFIPYFRNHSADDTKPDEPWAMGKHALEIARNYISLRYKLMPYLYSAFYESTQNGLPVMRSLAINYTFDPKILWPDYQNQYQFGDAFLVAPFESGKDFGKMYFPEGLWYDLYNGEKENGGQEKVVALTLNKLPVYVKGGSIIPMQSLIQTTAEQPTDTLYLHIYNGNRANSFVYYEDDGKTFDYKNGSFYKRLISFDPVKRSIIFDPAEGSYASHFKYIHVLMHGFEQVNAIQSGNDKIKVADGEFSFVGWGLNDDLQDRAYAPEHCSVKTVTINNDKGKIELTY